jgi:hypothetical protein
MGYDRAQEGPDKYLNPKFEIGNLQRAERPCNQVLKDNSNPEKLCGGMERSDTMKRCEAHDRRTARIRSRLRLMSIKNSEAVCREATRSMKRPSGNRTAFSFKGE